MQSKLCLEGEYAILDNYFQLIYLLQLWPDWIVLDLFHHSAF